MSEGISELRILETWIDGPRLPSRSVLYPLEPLGLGTSAVESLTSYTSRLSFTHCVSTSKLVIQVIAPLLGKDSLFDRDSALERIDGRLINGCSMATKNFVRALEKLTSRSDLRLLTMIPFSEAFGGRIFMGKHRAWCRVCYQEMRIRESIVYEPLVWALKHVNACPSHGRRLESICPFCNKHLKFLDRHSFPGYCSRCGNWLGVREQERDSPTCSSRSAVAEYTLWAARMVGDLLEAAPQMRNWPMKNRVPEVLRALIAASADGRVAPFATMLKINPTTISDWMSGRITLGLGSILSICHGCGISPLELLSGELEDLQSRVTRVSLSERQRSRSKNKKRVELQAIRQELELAVKEEPSPSLSEICSRLGLRLSYRRALRRRFPELVRQITRRPARKRMSKKAQLKKLAAMIQAERYPPETIHEVEVKLGQYSGTLKRESPSSFEILVSRRRAYRVELRMAKRAQSEETIRRAVMRLHEKHIYPSFPKVAALLPNVSMLRQ